MNDLISRQSVIKGLTSLAKARAKSDAQKSMMGRAMIFVERLPSVNPQANNEDIHREREQAYMKGYEDASKRYRTDPCEDAISRSEAIRVASGYCHWSNIPDELAKLPSVSAEKVGCCVEIDDEPHEVWECDHCGFVIDGSGCVDPYEYRDIYKYCPHCGCFMKGDNDERS